MYGKYPTHIVVWFSFLRARFSPSASLHFVSSRSSPHCKSHLIVVNIFPHLDVYVYRSHVPFANVIEAKMRSFSCPLTVTSSSCRRIFRILPSVVASRVLSLRWDSERVSSPRHGFMKDKRLHMFPSPRYRCSPRKWVHYNLAPASSQELTNWS